MAWSRSRKADAPTQGGLFLTSLRMVDAAPIKGRRLQKWESAARSTMGEADLSADQSLYKDRVSDTLLMGNSDVLYSSCLFVDVGPERS